MPPTADVPAEGKAVSRAIGGRVGDASAMARVLAKLPVDLGDAALQRKRQLLAEWCHVLGASYSVAKAPGSADLSPRQRQTLQRLLMGDSEKQIARVLELSPHTVHVYVKELYRRHEVSSRGELLALFVRRPFPHPAASGAGSDDAS